MKALLLDFVSAVVIVSAVVGFVFGLMLGDGVTALVSLALVELTLIRRK